jgi:hypothetical protein
MASRKGKGTLGDGQLKAIAAGRVAGKSATKIAAEIGVHPSTVEHRLATPEVRSLIERLEEKLEAKYERALDSALESLVKDNEHTDPEVRSKARSQTLGFVTARERIAAKASGEGKGGGQPGEGSFYLEELLYHVKVQREGAH